MVTGKLDCQKRVCSALLFCCNTMNVKFFSTQASMKKHSLLAFLVFAVFTVGGVRANSNTTSAAPNGKAPTRFFVLSKFS
jgi:hypothetical protein